MGADIGRLVDELAVPESPVARQVGADVEVVGERRQPKVAGRRGRQQRAGFGVEVAEPQEIARKVARQNGEIALHVTRGDAGRLTLESAAAGRKPRVTAGLRGGGRLARRAENRHDALPPGGGKNTRRPPILSSAGAHLWLARPRSKSASRDIAAALWWRMS